MNTVIGGSQDSGLVKVLPLVIAMVVIAGILYIGFSLFNTGKQPLECTVKYAEPPKDPLLKGTYWACNGLVCTRFMNPQEWVNKYCAIQNGETLCRVSFPDGGNYILPVGQLNLTAIRECAEYLCTQEVMVRNASYLIKTT